MKGGEQEKSCLFSTFFLPSFFFSSCLFLLFILEKATPPQRMTTPEAPSGVVGEDPAVEVSPKKHQEGSQRSAQQQQQQQREGHHARSSPAGTSTTTEPDSIVAPCLVARIDNARTAYNLLKAIHFKDRAVCVITPRGFKFTVEDAKSVQAHSYLQERSV